jgi:hypothetical protein
MGQGNAPLKCEPGPFYSLECLRLRIQDLHLHLDALDMTATPSITSSG